MKRNDERTKRVRWVNFYPPSDGNFDQWQTTSWITRVLADKNKQRGRLACVKVEFVDGDGLSDADQRTMAD